MNDELQRQLSQWLAPRRRFALRLTRRRADAEDLLQCCCLRVLQKCVSALRELGYDLDQRAAEFFSSPRAPADRRRRCRVSGASLRQPWRASMRYTLDSASGLPSRASILALSRGTTSTAPSAAPRNTSLRILASRASVALARLRNSRLLRGAARRPSDTAKKRVRMLHVAPTKTGTVKCLF